MSDINSYMQEIANRLWEPGLHGHASLMVGAGFSKNAKCVNGSGSMPDWEQLASKIFEEMYPRPTNEDEVHSWEQKKTRKISGKNVLTIAEEYAAAKSRKSLNALIEKTIDDHGYQPAELHKLLLELPWHDVFTTNYDTLLERTLPSIDMRTGCIYHLVTKMDDLPKSVQPRIVKLHGCIEHNKNYILTEEDYRSYPQKFAPFVNTVQQAMIETRLCLVGFSGDDPNFYEWLGWLRDNLGNMGLEIYMIGLWGDLSTSERKLLKTKRIKIVDLSELCSHPKNYSEAYEQLFTHIKGFRPTITIDSFSKLPHPLDKALNMSESAKHKLAADNELLKNLVVVPSAWLKNLSFAVHDWLKRYLKLDDSASGKIEVVYQLLCRLHFSLLPLYTSEADVLKPLFMQDKYWCNNDLMENSIRAEIGLMLCSMYRMDGVLNEFNECMSKLQSFSCNCEFSMQERVIIESCRFHVMIFDYETCKKNLELIQLGKASIKANLQKAAILIQIFEQNEALTLLNKIAANLANTRMRFEVLSGLFGYINLLGRALSIREQKNEVSLSDTGYEDSKFNPRMIINKLMDSFNGHWLFTNTKPIRRVRSFAPHQYSITKSFGGVGEELVQAAYYYTMFFEELCLPSYSDHKNAACNAITALERSSSNPYWRWSFIIRLYKKEINNTYFTRSRIAECEPAICIELCKKLMCMLSLNKKLMLLAAIENVLHLISVFALHAQGSVLFDVLSFFYEAKTWYKDDSSRVDACIQVLSHCADKSFFDTYFPCILDVNKCGGILPNKPFSYQLDCISDVDAILREMPTALISEEDEIRKGAIYVSMLLCKQLNYATYRVEIAEAMWSRCDQCGLPDFPIIDPLAWTELGYCDQQHYEEAMRRYLLQAKWMHKVNADGSVNHGTRDYDDIQTYLSALTFSSVNGTPDGLTLHWSNKELLEIIYQVTSYFEMEERAFSRATFLDVLEDDNRLAIDIIVEIIALIGTIAISAHVCDDAFQAEIEKAYTALAKVAGTENAISRTLMLMNGKTESAVSEFLDQWRHGKNEWFFFRELNRFFYLHEKCQIDMRFLFEYFEMMLTSIPLHDDQNLATLPLCLNALLYRDILISEKVVSSVTDGIVLAVQKVNTRISSSDCDVFALDDFPLDISVFCHSYHERLRRLNLSIPASMLSLIDLFKSSKYPEIRIVWDDYS